MPAARKKRTVAPKIAAVICTYNRYDLLGAAIDSCVAQSLDPEAFEIIVVDNSPDWDAAAEFGAAYAKVPNLSYVVEKTPGLSNARNVAAEMTEAEIVAYLDDDAIAKPDWLAGLLRAYDTFGPSAAVAGGKISPIWDVPRPAWLHDENLGYVSVVDWGGEARILGSHEWIAGANISFRRSYLLEVGGFDTNLGRKGPETSLLSNEETDVLKKVSELGGLTLYVPEAEIDHLVDRRRLDQEWFRRRTAWQAVSDYLKEPDVESWAPGAYDSMLDYLHRQPPRHRAISGLNRAVDEADEFRDQLGALYSLTLSALSGFKRSQ